jgi:hypothetical protein
MFRDLHWQGLSALKRLACAMVLLAAVGFYHARAAEEDAAFSQYLAQWLAPAFFYHPASAYVSIYCCNQAHPKRPCYITTNGN